MWRISILADFRPKLSCCDSLCSGKDFLFKSTLEHCDSNLKMSWAK